jgi:hypothetical protein
MRVVQLAIVLAFIAADIQWDYTPNMYLPFVLGVLIAYTFTKAWYGVVDLLALRRTRGRQFGG